MKGTIVMSERELTRLKMMQRLEDSSVRQSQVAENLGISVRQVKRLWKAYRQWGAKGLISKRRGAKSNHRLPDEVKEKALELIAKKYADFGPTLAREKLVEVHGLTISVGSVRNLMITGGIWIPKRVKKKRIFQMRPRRPREGELTQVDGSEDAWLEDRGPKCTLLVYADDATSRLQLLRFVESESTCAYFEATRCYIECHGRPLAFYSDRHAVFRVNRNGALSGSGLTQFGLYCHQ